VKIIRLKAENVKRLNAVEIQPDGNLVIIGGDNEAGKTSVLDSIEMALGGKESVPPEPIRKGAKKAEVVADLGELVVTRSFTKKGTYLTVTTAEGEKPKSPQAILDKLVGTLSFDPLEFSRMAQKQQAEVLRELLGLDFAPLEKKRQQAFDERTGVNRDVKRLSAQLEGMQHFPEAPEEPIDVSQVSEDLRVAQASNEVYRQKHDAATHAEAAVQEWQARAEELKAELQVAEQSLAVARETLAKASEEATAAQQVDESEFHEKLVSASEVNRQVDANARREEVIGNLQTQQMEADRLTRIIQGVDEEKENLLTGAQMPIKGLSLTDQGVTFEGIPFEQCSGSQQLRVSLAMGLAMNPKLRVLLIRDGSLLDEKRLRMVAEMAEKADAQVWIERVGDKDKTAVIIEDGTVKETVNENQ
jgi:DNA repair exonuclease SbcCD ATPase subunit